MHLQWLPPIVEVPASVLHSLLIHESESMIPEQARPKHQGMHQTRGTQRWQLSCWFPFMQLCTKMQRVPFASKKTSHAHCWANRVLAGALNQTWPCVQLSPGSLTSVDWPKKKASCCLPVIKTAFQKMNFDLKGNPKEEPGARNCGGSEA